MPIRRADLPTRVIDGEVVILDRAGGNVHQLNVTASQVWNECDGTHSAADIVAQLVATFEEAPEDVILHDVSEIIMTFRRHGLLRTEPSADNVGEMVEK